MAVKGNRLNGATEAVSVLKRLPQKIQRKVLRGTARKAAALARTEIRQRTPIGPIAAEDRKGKRATYGKGRKNIRAVRDGGTSRPGHEVYVVDVGKAFWLYFYERGTSRQPPRPFFVPSFEGAIGGMLARMVDELRKGVIREASKLAGPRARSGRARR